MKKRILFVCLGNICRSPAADGIMRGIISEAGKDDEWEVDSAVVGMDRENERDLRRLAPSREAAQRIMSMEEILADHPTHNIVPDPYYGTSRDFELALDLIEYACQRLAQQFGITK